MDDATSLTVFSELCELTPVEIDNLRADHPELGIPANFGAADMETIGGAILENRSPGDTETP